MKKVSIIVPIYNEEKNLKRCINSLVNETYQNLEIILINDGSTDNSQKIIDEFSDKRIIKVSQKNSGIGTTRNKGIELTTGDYIMFVDSDDYIEPNCVEVLVNKIEKDKTDIVISNYYLDTKNKSYNISFKDLGITSLKENPNLLVEINLAPWNKIYKSYLFKEKKNRFPLHLKYEDAPVVVKAINDAKKVSFTSDYLFHYVMNNSGETITRDERIFDIITICAMIEKELKNMDSKSVSNLLVKILMPYLKNSRYIYNKKIQNEFINAVYIYLRKVDKNWTKASYLKKESFLKCIILTHKPLLKLVNIIKK